MLSRRHHHTPTETVQIQNPDDTDAGGGGAAGTLVRCWCKWKIAQPLWKTVGQLLPKPNMLLPYGPASTPCGILSKGVERSCSCKNLHAVLIAALFILAQTWK